MSGRDTIIILKYTFEDNWSQQKDKQIFVIDNEIQRKVLKFFFPKKSVARSLNIILFTKVCTCMFKSTFQGAEKMSQ